MKNFFSVLMILALLFSCNSDEDSLQRIDQKIQFYFRDAAGNDLLIPNKIGAYSTVTWDDELALQDNAAVTVNRTEISDSVYVLEYLAGATREFVKDSSDGSKIYRSLIEVSLVKKISDTENEEEDLDTLEIEYRMHPSVFEVSKVFYNSELKFSKVQGQPNVVTVIK